jgi:hypothetical protein
MRLDPNLLLELVIAAAAVGGWLLVFALALVATRPADVAPAPPTQDFGGEESPAVVSLLANRWEVTEDAGESTLIDLAARKYLEFRQPGNDPMQTTIHVRGGDMAGLLPYERRIFDRVSALAVGGVVPLPALTFRDQQKAAGWAKRLRAEVVADARSRGLSQRRFSPTVVSAITAAALVAGAGVALAVAHYLVRRHDSIGGAFWAGLVTFGVLVGFAGKGFGERDTAAGRAVAARWLGLRAYLRGDESFADLPPAAVAVWDRYLSYGDALGTTRVCSAVIDLGMGNRRRVWSSFGGTWHRVRVSYPSFWGRYGQKATGLIVRAALTLIAGYAVLRLRHVPVELVREEVPRFHDLADLVTLVLGVALVVRGAYRLVRTVLDLALPLTLTGEVLWIEVWRSSGGGENSPPTPWLHYLAVDDGSGDRTTAWGLPTELTGRFDCGDLVRLTVRRWTRRVLDVSIVERGSAARVAAADVTMVDPDSASNPVVSGVLSVLVRQSGASQVLASALSPAAVTAAQLVTVEEASRAVGQPLSVHPASRDVAGPVSVEIFAGTDQRPAVQLMVAHGPMARLAMRAQRRHQALPGIGDEAYTGEHWATARRGDTVVAIHLQGMATRTDPRGLYWLLSTATGRLPG